LVNGIWFVVLTQFTGKESMKVYLDVIGCRLNQSEIERMAAQFRAVGHEIVASADLADVVV